MVLYLQQCINQKDQIQIENLLPDKLEEEEIKNYLTMKPP
jgi:hypothetical protein